MRRRLEELPLEVVARPPGQAAADVQPLALDVQEHVLGEHALGRVGVVGAAGRVDVVVAAVAAVVRRVDPALELDLDRRVALAGTVTFFAMQPVLRPAAVGHRQLARRQQHGAAVGAVDLLLEEEVGGEPLGLRRDRRGPAGR